GAGAGWSGQVKTPLRPPNDFAATGAPLDRPTSASTWDTTLRMRDSLICMGGFMVQGSGFRELGLALCRTPNPEPFPSLLSRVHTLLINMHLIDDADDDRVDRHV